MVYFIPNGIKNIAGLFPDVDFSKVTKYYLQVKDDEETVVATTPVNQIGCCCNDRKARVHFLNQLGTWDAINFNEPKSAYNVTSSEYQRSLSTPLAKPSTGIERFNVKANTSYEARTDCYSAVNHDWCMELLTSPQAFIEWKGTQGQSDSFLPIRIEDAKFEKNPKSFLYTLVIIYKMSNEKIIIRN